MTETERTSAEDRVFRLIYRSRNLIPGPDRKVEHGALFSHARSNNKQQHISGALLLSGDWFVQTLEGDEDAVRALYTTIEGDPRHDSVTLVDTQTVEDRVFARWAMTEVAAEGEPDIPLIAHRDGISSAAGRGTTQDQEAILDVMRQASRGDAATV